MLPLCCPQPPLPPPPLPPPPLPQVNYLCDFVNRPELTQTLASSQGAGDWKCELHLRPEQLARKYHEVVPDHLRICRSEVLEYLRQDCFRLSRAKSCLCGLCEEHGWQNFEDLVTLIKELGLGAKQTAGLVARVRQLQDYLKTEYRRLCTTALQTGCQRGATLCIPYALCGEGEFSCSCKEKEHEMGFEQCNERFYLFDDIREALQSRRRQLQSELDALDAVTSSWISCSSVATSTVCIAVAQRGFRPRRPFTGGARGSTAAIAPPPAAC